MHRYCSHLEKLLTKTRMHHITRPQRQSQLPNKHARPWLGYIKSMPFRPNLVAVLRLYFGALATGGGASLIHCLAGKDRTGFAVGLLHKLLGTHDDDIRAD